SALAVASADIRLGAQASAYAAERATLQAPGIGVLGGQRVRTDRDRRIANVPAFTPPAISASGRISAGQQQVWDKVAEKNAKFKTHSATGTYRAALNLAEGDAKKSGPPEVRPLPGSRAVAPVLLALWACFNGKAAGA